MAKVLVTGGTGFLGAYLLYHLLKEDKPVKALKRPDSSFYHLKLAFEFLGKEEGYSREQSAAELDKIEWVEAELLDTDMIRSTLSDVDTIYHSAAKVSFNPKETESILATNYEGTANLVNMAIEKGVTYFHHVSSVSSLERKPDQWINESLTRFPKKFPTIYGESKFRGEREAWRGYAEGLKGVIINPAVIIGPGSLDRGAGDLFKQFMKGMSFYPEGGNAYVDARDVVECLLKLRDKPEAYQNRYIIVSETLPMRSVMNRIAEAFNVKKPVFKANLFMSLSLAYAEKMKSAITGSAPLLTPELAKMGTNSYYYDTSGLHEQINHKFRPVEETIDLTCRFIKQYGLHQK